MTAAALAALLVIPARAQEWRDEPRRILILYEPSQIPGNRSDPFFMPAHQHAELPLNHLGLFADYLDASKPLPEWDALGDVRGVYGWFPSERAFKDPDRVCAWLTRGLALGKRVVLTGKLGLYSSDDPSGPLSPACRDLFSAFGARPRGARNVEPLMVSVSSANTALVGFERAVDPSENPSAPLIDASTDSRVHLALRFRDGARRESSPVFVNARGGIALDPYWLYSNEDLEPAQFRWVVNPFRFFEEAYGLSGLPRPDATTLGGRRIFMTHVDGDGFYNISEFDKSKISGEVYWDQIIRKYPWTPMTISLIAGYFDLPLYNDAQAMALAKRILTASNVEPASHGYAHPLIWAKGTLAVLIPRYVMDAAKEITGAARMLEERVLGDGRRIRLHLWTGDCLPEPAQIEVAEKSGMLHMNGGGGRFDGRYRGYAHLYPLARFSEKGRQVYAPSFNENEYTELWSERFFGYREVLETFVKTGSPLRVKPVGVYVHFYSAERYASLEALKGALAWAHAQPLFPIWAGRYAEIVRDFFALKIRAKGRRYRLEGGAAVRTVRFDDEPGVPDMASSIGVLGYRREGGSLYVSLADFSPREIAMTQSAKPRPYLEESNFDASAWTVSVSSFSFRMDGWWDPQFSAAGLRPGAFYRVRFPWGERLLQSDSHGRLSVSEPAPRPGLPTGTVSVEHAG